MRRQTSEGFVHLRGALIVAVVLAMALGGCVYKPADNRPTYTPAPPIPHGTPPSEPTPAPIVFPSSSPTPAPTRQPNPAPTASISASSTTGKVLANVTFTLNATDPANETVWWTFNADGRGADEAHGTSQDLPASVRFTFAGGNFSATFTVTDGPNTVRLVQWVNVTPAAPQPLQHITGKYTAGLPDSCQGETYAPGGFVKFDVLYATWNRVFTVDYNLTAPAASLHVYFRDGAWNMIPTSMTNPPPGSTQVVGRVPANALFGYITSCGGAEVKVDYVVPGEA